MLFKNINLWNVSEVEYIEDTKSYRLYRLNKDCEVNMFDQGRKMNRTNLGVELRFKMIDDEISLVLKAPVSGVKAYVYFGGIQAEWFQCSFAITENDTIITIKKPKYEYIEKISQLKNSIYDCNLVRVLFDEGELHLVDVIGNVEPALDLLPKKVMLSYGSSITSNSLTYIPMLGYPYLIAKKFGYDLINIGYSGSCRMEKEVVDAINEKDFNIATIELGINIIDDMQIEEFYKRAYYLLDNISLKHPVSKLFVIDIYNYFNEACGVNKYKLRKYRNVIKTICEELNRENIIYIPAKTLLKSRMNLTADLVHPDLDGHLEIYNHLSKVIRKHI